MLRRARSTSTAGFTRDDMVEAKAIVQGSRYSIRNDRPHVVIAAVLEAMCEARADR